jgi:hypothetical protein
LKPAAQAYIYRPARRRGPRLKSGVFCWASDIHSFMLRGQIELPRRITLKD